MKLAYSLVIAVIVVDTTTRTSRASIMYSLQAEEALLAYVVMAAKTSE